MGFELTNWLYVFEMRTVLSKLLYKFWCTRERERERERESATECASTEITYFHKINWNVPPESPFIWNYHKTLVERWNCCFLNKNILECTKTCQNTLKHVKMTFLTSITYWEHTHLVGHDSVVVLPASFPPIPKVVIDY